MERDDVGAGLREIGDVLQRLRDHQMDIQRDARVTFQALQHRDADGDVRDEMTVHDVVVQPVGAGLFHALRVGTEGAEVGGQERGGNQDHNKTSKSRRCQFRQEYTLEAQKNQTVSAKSAKTRKKFFFSVERYAIINVDSTH